MQKKPDLTILSLGWGVQSFTLAAMSALGELPPLDFAIHADTTHEQAETYRFVAKWTPWLERWGVKVVNVKGSNTDLVKNGRETPIPAFTLSETGKYGQLRRQCTDHWKIRPMRKHITSVLGTNRGVTVEQWLGVSLDEVERARLSDVRYIVHSYPLLDNRVRRAECVNWLNSKGLEVPPKSSCVFCPYHNKQVWRDLKYEQPADFERACHADEKIRHTRPPYPLFVHPARKPLRELDLRVEVDFGQLSLFSEECNGVCFL